MTSPVSVSLANGGFGWSTVLIGLLNLLVGGVFVQLIRSRPALKKIANEREANLLNERAEEMGGMRKRIRELEGEISELRKLVNQQASTIEGLQRQLIMFQVATGRALPVGTNSPEIENMLAILSPLFGEQAAKSSALQAAEDTCDRAGETKDAADLAVEQIKQDESVQKGPK